MEKICLTISLVLLAATITIGSISIALMGSAPMVANAPVCNCIDGFSGEAGVVGWDPVQGRVRCRPINCHIIV